MSSLCVLSPIDDFAMGHWKVPAKGAADKRPDASEQDSGASTGDSSVALAGPERGANPSANRSSSCYVSRVAVFEAHLTYPLALVRALRWIERSAGAVQDMFTE